MNPNTKTVPVKVNRQMSPLCAGRPDPPFDVRVLSCVADLVELTWVTSGDNNAPVIEYIVYYTNTTDGEPGELVEGARFAVRDPDGLPEGETLTTVVFTKPWVTYEFFVAATNEIGMSDMASQAEDGTPAVCTTPSTAPRRNPDGVCTRLGGPHQLIIIWQVSAISLHCTNNLPGLLSI